MNEIIEYRNEILQVISVIFLFYLFVAEISERMVVKGEVDNYRLYYIDKEICLIVRIKMLGFILIEKFVYEKVDNNYVLKIFNTEEEAEKAGVLLMGLDTNLINDKTGWKY